MPTNASYEYFRAQTKFEQARSAMEKLAALQEMISAAPKHKGAENLRAELSKKAALLRKEIEKQKEQQAKRGSGASISVKKEGIGQVALVGLPNSGKSTVLRTLTGVDVKIAPYEFTTTQPEVGMMDYKGAWIQLVEIPALIEGSSEGKANGTRLLSVIRNADAIVLVLSAEKALAELAVLKKELSSASIRVNESRPDIRIEQSEFKGISIAGKQFLKISVQQVEDFFKSLGKHNVSIVFNEEVKDIMRIAQALDEKIVYKKALVLLNNKGLGVQELKEKNAFVLNDLKKDKGELGQRIFALLDRVIIYTKKPGQEADLNEPLVLPKGATIEDVARQLHKELASKIKSARVWGSTRFEGQKVGKDYALQNFDIVEIEV
jgi:small GTP-binding protein